MDEVHFRAAPRGHPDLRTKWVLNGEPAFVDSTSSRLREKATYYSSVCLETGEVDAMSLTENCTAETSVTFLQQLRTKCGASLIIIWDNGPMHYGPAPRGHPRTYLATPDLNLRLVALPAYSPDFNPDEAIWRWAREEATANTCSGTAAKVREAMDRFFVGLVERTSEVKQRCRKELQAQADVLMDAAGHLPVQTQHVDLTLDSV